MFLVKYDTSGNFQWGQTNQASPNSFSNSVAVDTKQNAYVTGWLEAITTFSSNDGNDITVTGFSTRFKPLPIFPVTPFSPSTIAMATSSG